MVNRRPNVIGLVVLASIYWGALYYWLRFDLTSDVSEVQTEALLLFGLSIPYVAYVIWAAMSDLPERLSSIPFIGKFLKFYIWLGVLVIGHGKIVALLVTCSSQ